MPDPKTPAEFFARARQLSDLEASGIPFHLKATYVATGDTEFTGNGTYEEWWQSKDLWRTEATLGDYKYVAIKNGDKETAAATDAYTPLRVRELMELQIFHIEMPKENKEKWKLSQGTEGSGTKIVTEEKPCDSRYKSFVCTHQFEFTERGFLQSYRVNDLLETYAGFQPFEKLSFPRRVVVTLRGDALLTVDITSLDGLSGFDRRLFHTSTDAALRAVPSQLIEGISAEDVTPPKLVHNVRMKYPKSERKTSSESTGRYRLYD
jgi:hypothetical protein